MAEYDIEIEIYPDDDTVYVYTPRGSYTYSIESVEGKEIIDKIFGSEVRATVYTQNEEMSLDEWNNTKDK